MDAWTLALTGNRTILYVCFAVSLGAALWLGIFNKQSELFRHFRKTIIVSASIGILASILNLLIQAGSFAGDGLAGMLDPLYIKILWSTGNGTASLLLFLGFTILLISTLLTAIISDNYSKAIIWLFSFIATVVFVLSFSASGHFKNSSVYNHIILGVHVTTVAIWLGSLWPLYIINQKADLSFCQQVMKQFSKAAMIAVALLVSCGIWLSYQLVGNWHTLFNSHYGQFLLVKIGIVFFLLSLAATNKLYWVPRIQQTKYRSGLSRFIFFEMLLGFAILSLTAVLTTVIGID